MNIFKRISITLVSMLLWFFVAISALAFFLFDFLLWLLTFWWDRQLKLLHAYSTYWAMFYVWINPGWKIKRLGFENIDKTQTYVIVSNHQSAFDIVLLYGLYTHFKWVAKKELAKVPVIGWNLKLNNCILLERASATSARNMIIQGLKHLKEGSSVLIFPEGTRSRDGLINRFKEGAFMLAKQANVPILPVVIDGSKDLLPEPLKINLKQILTIKVLKPIPIEEVLSKTTEELAKKVNEIIANEHKAMVPQKYKTLEQ